MFLTKKHLSRRTVLRGLGVSVALPLLDSMVPAQTPLAKTAANPVPHMGFIYFPHGAVMNLWTPSKEGTDFEFPAIIKPLEPFRKQLTIVSGLGNRAGREFGSARDNPRDMVKRSCSARESRSVHGDHGGPDRGKASGPGYAFAFARADDGRTIRRGRRLRSGLRLQLFRDHFVPDAKHASADGIRSPQGVRASVRPGQFGSREEGEEREIHQHSGCDREGSRRPATGTGGARIDRGSSDYLESVREIERRIEKLRAAANRADRSAGNSRRHTRCIR